jgi:hypothetical protein
MNFSFKLLSVLILSLLIFSCGSDSSNPYSFAIKGTLSNSNNEWILIQKLLPNGVETIDSVEIDDQGNFEMDFKSNQSPELFLLKVKNYPWRITLLMTQDETLTIKADALYLNQNYKVEGSEGSNKIRLLNETINQFMADADSIYFQYRTIAADSNTLDVRRLADSLLFQNYNQTYKFVRKFCIDNKDNLAGIIGLYSRYGEKLILDTDADFDVFEMVAKGNFSVNPTNSHALEINNFVKTKVANRDLKEEIEQNLMAGNKMPNFDLPNPEMKNLSLDNFKNDYLIVSFWISNHKTSWDNNAGLKMIKENFASDSLSIVSVGMDRDKLVWANTIALDKLNWYHVLADEKTFESFNLKSAPRLFFVSPMGIIISKDPSIDSLKVLVNQYIKK